ncbi:phage holin family protein [Trueperella sp. LYQ143]|uniref:phage holin family protein n=1 Tax=unclassified Trueperella TaxID=2630174 RepID=UPI003983410A
MTDKDNTSRTTDSEKISLSGDSRPAPTTHSVEGPQTLSGRSPVKSGPGTQSIGELVAKVTAQFSALVRDEITYTKLQATQKVKNLGTGGVMFAIAGVLALYMFGILLLAGGYALSLVVPLWAAFLIVAGILLLVILILALIGKSKMDAAKKNVIDPAGGMKKNVAAVKKGIKK